MKYILLSWNLWYFVLFFLLWIIISLIPLGIIVLRFSLIRCPFKQKIISFFSQLIAVLTDALPWNLLCFPCTNVSGLFKDLKEVLIEFEVPSSLSFGRCFSSLISCHYGYSLFSSLSHLHKSAAFYLRSMIEFYCISSEIPSRWLH